MLWIVARHGALALAFALVVTCRLGEANLGGHHWPNARGHEGSYMLTDETLPRNFSSALAWSFHHPDGRRATVMRGNPLIDSEKNVLICTEKALFKLDPDGHVLWKFKHHSGLLNIVPSIWGDTVYGASGGAWLFAVDLRTGREAALECAALLCVWVGYPLCRGQGRHSGRLKRPSYDCVFLPVLAAVEAVKYTDGGNKRVIGVNASSGKLIWEFRPEVPVWNFSPLHVGDGTFIFMDYYGGVIRLFHNNGTKAWYAAVAPPPASAFTDGGVMLNPDGTAAFSCSHLATDRDGVLRRYRISDGALEWAKNLPTGCTSWPALSKSGDFGVVAAGSFVTMPLIFHLPSWMPMPVKVALHLFSLAMGDSMQKFIPIPRLRTDLIAFDPRTGETLWSYTTPEWRRMAAMGDEEGALSRGSICLPTSWGAPTISGDGTVHVGHLSGILYGVKDHNGDGHIDPETEVATFDMGDAPLPNNPAWAPGMMAVASCDQVFVFKT